MTVTAKRDTKPDDRPTVTHPTELAACDAALRVTDGGMEAINRAYYLPVMPALLSWVTDEIKAKSMPPEIVVTVSYFAKVLGEIVAPALPVRKGGAGNAHNESRLEQNAVTNSAPAAPAAGQP